MKKLTAVKIILSIAMLALLGVSIAFSVTRKKLPRIADAMMTLAEWAIGTVMTIFKLQELKNHDLLEDVADDFDDEDF